MLYFGLNDVLTISLFCHELFGHKVRSILQRQEEIKRIQRVKWTLYLFWLNQEIYNFGTMCSFTKMYARSVKPPIAVFMISAWNCIANILYLLSIKVSTFSKLYFNILQTNRFEDFTVLKLYNIENQASPDIVSFWFSTFILIFCYLMNQMKLFFKSTNRPRVIEPNWPAKKLTSWWIL